MPRTLADRRAAADRFDFRHTHPALKVGTASDRYAAWLGQIYPLDVWQDRVETRAKKTSKGTFEERMLPIESADDYFQHFDVLEIDFTYYRPLLSAEGKPESNYFTLQQYVEHSPPDARFLLKVPGLFFARQRRSSSGGEVRFTPNASYLDADAFVVQFQEPAIELLGDRLGGFLFEQEYQRKDSAPDADAFVDELAAFFETVPPDVQPHLEIRTPSLLTPAYFGFLEDAGFGHVFSHWQYLPPIREQWQKAGQRFTAADGTAVARLLSPLRMSFEDAFAQAFPFEAPVEALVNSEETQRMVLDAVALAFQAERQQAVLNLIVNNRAYGNAPELARRIAHRVLDEAERRGDG